MFSIGCCVILTWPTVSVARMPCTSQFRRDHNTPMGSYANIVDLFLYTFHQNRIAKSQIIARQKRLAINKKEDNTFLLSIFKNKTVKIALTIILCEIVWERFRRCNFRRTIIPSSLFQKPVEMIARSFRCFHLRVAMCQNDRSILRADIVALAVFRCWVMSLPENVKHFLVAGFAAVEDNVHYLGVSCRTGAYGTVGRIFCVSTGVTDTGRINAFGFPKLAFGTPETMVSQKQDRGRNFLLLMSFLVV